MASVIIWILVRNLIFILIYKMVLMNLLQSNILNYTIVAKIYFVFMFSLKIIKNFTQKYKLGYYFS